MLLKHNEVPQVALSTLGRRVRRGSGCCHVTWFPQQVWPSSAAGQYVLQCKVKTSSEAFWNYWILIDFLIFLGTILVCLAPTECWWQGAMPSLRDSCKITMVLTTSQAWNMLKRKRLTTILRKISIFGMKYSSLCLSLTCLHFKHDVHDVRSLK